MARPPHDPLAGIERLLVDGTNLLYAIEAGPGPAPAATLVGRLRAVIPAAIRIEILFDGSAEPGMRDTRIAHGVTVRHAGRISADALALRLVTEATGGHPAPSGVPALLVVTDDGGLARDLRARGAATIGASWLVRRLARPRLAAPSVGRPAPPPSASGTAHGAAGGEDPDGERPGWQPGRGATTKRGNPRRSRRRS
ncbi:MAG: hypothetical protein ACHQ3P_03320 [Candidatus Limnocylindrales bacterium]